MSWFVAAVVVGVAIVAVLALAYNRLVSLRAAVRASWSNVDVELRRRHDLITNLVAVVGATATHERSTQEAVARARSASNTGVRLGEERNVSALARQLVAIAEAHPSIVAQRSFLELQSELTVTEDRIAAARRLHNNGVMSLNRRVESFPLMVLARVAGIGTEPYLEFDRAIEVSPTVGIDLHVP